MCIVMCAILAFVRYCEKYLSALPWGSVDLDFPTKLLDDLLVDTQAQPYALGGNEAFLCLIILHQGEKLKEIVNDVFFHTHP